MPLWKKLQGARMSFWGSGGLDLGCIMQVCNEREENQAIFA